MSDLLYEQKAPVSLERLGLITAGEQLDTACQQAAAQGWSYSHFAVRHVAPCTNAPLATSSMQRSRNATARP